MYKFAFLFAVLKFFMNNENWENNEPMTQVKYNLLIANNMGTTHRYRWKQDQLNFSTVLLFYFVNKVPSQFGTGNTL